ACPPPPAAAAGGPAGPSSQHQESGFFKSILCREIALGMKRAWHQLPPAVSVQQAVDRAVAGDMPDRFLVGRLEIMNVQHLAGASRFGKTRELGLVSEQRPVLVVASASRLGLERLDAAVVISHVRAVHRTQRHAHCSRNRRLRHPTLTQQHHLDALARCGRYLPPQRSFQPSHLGFAAFDHLFPPESDGPSESQLGDEKQLAKRSLQLKKLDSSRYRGGIRSANRTSVICAGSSWRTARPICSGVRELAQLDLAPAALAALFGRLVHISQNGAGDRVAKPAKHKSRYRNTDFRPSAFRLV